MDFDDDTMETDLDLVDLQEDRSGFNQNKPIKQVLTVQEKLAQDYPSLPPQAEVYMNLLDDDFAAGVDQPSSYQAIDRYMLFCLINCSYQIIAQIETYFGDHFYSQLRPSGPPLLAPAPWGHDRHYI